MYMVNHSMGKLLVGVEHKVIIWMYCLEYNNSLILNACLLLEFETLENS